MSQENGNLKPIQKISTLPDGTDPIGSTAEVQVHPSGKFLYGSNRGHDTIVVYQIDEKSGKLTWVENESDSGKGPSKFWNQSRWEISSRCRSKVRHGGGVRD